MYPADNPLCIAATPTDSPPLADDKPATRPADETVAAEQKPEKIERAAVPWHGRLETEATSHSLSRSSRSRRSRFGKCLPVQEMRMAKKHERVPGMRETRPNREQRRHPERPADEPLARDLPEPHTHGPQDVSSVRAKNSGHGKKTADKWNQ